MKIRHRAVAALPALLLPVAALAHNTWLQPSKTVLSTGQWVTFDGGASTQPFVKDHAPLRLDHLQITAPDGTSAQPENVSTGTLRSSFDLQLAQEGTYRIAIVMQGMSAMWEEAQQRRRWPGRGEAFTAEGFAKAVPADAQNLRVSEMIRRLETYVTAGQPNDTALKPSGKGLELTPVTAFNDLYANESATFRLVLDGKPARDLAVEVIADGIRYRDAVQPIELKTDADGRLTIAWPGPGLYWVNASVQDDHATPPATSRSASYTGVFEVLSP
ncbi:DUF4198 domain-containing protein [Sinimarinibacterium sp. CAU 1509]|uniref:DUF4198 domain-containing protein n=1 Tax=Sinimarinibacterium sp. CAU 1509 TaxID=2562283 RepID=UPI0010AB5F20|nr:DUF4198 domain-containing protein [Sinimarinibacterium sp. CAU 1509]TJY56598.1 DUF4198 domain-containing protein [Sinimarinibacterium sp. CAU 1509]